MRFEHYGWQVGLRIAVLFAALLALALAIAADREYSLWIAMALLVGVAAVVLIRYTHAVVRQLTAVLEGFPYGDFRQRAGMAKLGPSFQALEQKLELAAERAQDLRAADAKEAAYMRSLVQHLPLPFLVLHDDGAVDVLNLATRRMFNTATIANADELVRYGAPFQRDVLQVQAGESLLSSVLLEGVDEYYILTATTIRLDGRVQKLVAFSNVQGELDATELATWQNLLRVTSHEILNSLTPVAHCAQTADSLVGDLLSRDIDDPELQEEMQDIRDAVDTVARRSEGLMRFVRSYRQLTRMPPPETQRIELADYFARLDSLLNSELAQKRIEMTTSTRPQGLSVQADRDMLDQALINLVRNAVDAVRDAGEGRIELRAYIDNRQRVVLEVEDNGTGVEPETAKSMFIPFFTTRGEGSGVGLALVRYIMLAHGGTAAYVPVAEGGSVFRLVF